MARENRTQVALYASTHQMIKEIIDSSTTDRKPTIADIVHAAVSVLHDRAVKEANEKTK